ncbi:MAG: methyltransferase domain-containing protein [Alphaproteobacteria bacterium]|nr:methyltransferase domain-containing protein [Alphaproteobacteria bacterium]
MATLPSKAKITSSFDNAALTYDSASEIQKQSAKHLIKMITSNKFSVNSILDIGCGTGHVSVELRKKYPFASFDLCDISQNMLHIAEAKLKQQVQLICADAESFHFVKHYDLGIANLSLQWFDSIEEFLPKILRTCSTFAFTTLLNTSFRQYKNLFQTPPTFEYPSFQDLLRICKTLNRAVHYDIRKYTKTCDNMFGVSRYFTQLGANLKSTNQPVLKSNKSNLSINLEYDVFFCCLTS